MNSPGPRIAYGRGFSLIELAVVLVIVTLLAGGLLVSLSAQREEAARQETQRRLQDARDALLGFAAANGRLPCPAAPNATGIEAPAAGGTCTAPWNGYLPAVTLGLGPTDRNGYMVDAWENPIRYAVTTVLDGGSSCATASFTTSHGVKTAWNSGSTLAADLSVCTSANGISGTTCASGFKLTGDAVAVIFSLGSNGGTTTAGLDEAANTNNDRAFVYHTVTTGGANPFDDQVIWLSPNILYNRLIAAGRLP